MKEDSNQNDNDRPSFNQNKKPIYKPSTDHEHDEYLRQINKGIYDKQINYGIDNYPTNTNTNINKQQYNKNKSNINKYNNKNYPKQQEKIERAPIPYNRPRDMRELRHGENVRSYNSGEEYDDHFYGYHRRPYYENLYSRRPYNPEPYYNRRPSYYDLYRTNVESEYHSRPYFQSYGRGDYEDFYEPMPNYGRNVNSNNEFQGTSRYDNERIENYNKNDSKYDNANKNSNSNSNKNKNKDKYVNKEKQYDRERPVNKLLKDNKDFRMQKNDDGKLPYGKNNNDRNNNQK
jgi:hypothetical protein